MQIAYVDTSCLAAIAFSEPGWEAVAARMARFDILVASNLLEAELRSALVRNGCQVDPGALLATITWIHPDRALSPEYIRVLATGPLRGADLAHLACALYLSPQPAELAFVTLNVQQGAVAGAVGFPTDAA